VPVPLSELVLVVVLLTPAPPAVVVVVELSCAKTVPIATAQAAPVANIFINRVCFIFVLCFG
jgi:hypothetical protein